MSQWPVGGCPQCAGEEMLRQSPEAQRVNDLLKDLQSEYQTKIAEDKARQAALTRLLPGFTEVSLPLSAMSGYGHVTLYECDKCAALVRPYAEAQTRHKLGACS
jgi:hypothetical protein